MLHTTGQTIATIQLIQDGVALSSLSSGRIQVRLTSEWGNICGDKTTSPITVDEGDAGAASSDILEPLQPVLQQKIGTFPNPY